MIRRPTRRVPAILTALVVLALAVGLAVACVQVLLGQAPWVSFTALAALGAGLTPADPAVLAAAGALAVIGLVLILSALVPGVPTVLPLAGDGPRTGTTRRGLRAALTATADRVDGVAHARVQVRRRQVTAVVTTAYHDTAPVRAAVRAALADHITRIGPARLPRVRVRATTLRRS
jgi:hypothetical protein